MDSLTELLGGDTEAGRVLDTVTTAMEQEGDLTTAAAVAMRERISETVLPGLVVLFDDLLGHKLPRWTALQQREILTESPSGGAEGVDTIGALAELRHRVEQATAATLEARRTLCDIETAGVPAGELLDAAQGLLSAVIRRSTVFTAPPPQVLKTTNKFNVAVTCLAGNAVEMTQTPIVRLSVLSEAQARELHAADAADDLETAALIGTGRAGHGTFSKGEAEMTFDQPTDSTTAWFRGTALRSVKRAAAGKGGASKGDLAVTEEKFAVVARTTLSVEGQLVPVVTMSPPVVVIVHGMQLHNARATILWDSAYLATDRVPFEVPDCAPWETVAELLQGAFRAVTGSELTEEQLTFLGSKLAPPEAELSGPPDVVYWKQFNKTPLPGRGFTFWEWFCCGADLIHKCLDRPWHEGSIIGFVGKERVGEWLTGCGPGTFVIRFSESVLGGVTVSWVSMTEMGPQVLHLQPWYAKDFGMRSLVDRLNDLQQFDMLYPDIPKAVAFPPPPSGADVGDYVGTQVVCRMDAGLGGIGAAQDLGSPRSDYGSPAAAAPADFGPTDLDAVTAAPTLPPLPPAPPVGYVGSVGGDNPSRPLSLNLGDLLADVAEPLDLSDLGFDLGGGPDDTPHAHGGHTVGYSGLFPLRSQRDIL
mmetsp:Transcript_22408/g.67416  ORF Transcript_22408/g.67416 Transcript_22408/m.67416 type:complete len:646 (+) Transcript_22408:224-2161(+)